MPAGHRAGSTPAPARDPDAPTSCSIDTLLVGPARRCSSTRSSHLILPAIALGSIPFAIITRITRASVLDVTNEDYVRTARAKGLTERRVDTRHIMRNAWLPVITVIGLQVGGLLGRRGHHRDGLRLERRRPLGRRRHPEPRLLRDPEHDPDLRPDLPPGEPPGRHRLRVPQPADPVRLMADRRRPPLAVRPERAPAAACGATPAGACCATGRRSSGWSASRSSWARRCSPRSSRRTTRSTGSSGGPAPAAVADAPHGHRHAGPRRVQPGPLRGPGQPHRGRRRRSSSALIIGGIIGALGGRPRRQGRLGPDAHRRRPAGGPGHPAGDRDRRLARPGPAADHARRRGRQHADLRPPPARQPARPARGGLRHGGAFARGVAARACCCATCCRTR